MCCHMHAPLHRCSGNSVVAAVVVVVIVVIVVVFVLLVVSGGAVVSVRGHATASPGTKPWHRAWQEFWKRRVLPVPSRATAQKGSVSLVNPHMRMVHDDVSPSPSHACTAASSSMRQAAWPMMALSCYVSFSGWSLCVTCSCEGCCVDENNGGVNST